MTEFDTKTTKYNVFEYKSINIECAKQNINVQQGRERTKEREINFSTSPTY